MNGSEAKYSSEYVEIQTSLERIRTKLESIESAARDLQLAQLDLLRKVEETQTGLAGVKATAAVFGGVAGSLIAVLLRFLLSP
ncbi:MAG: hypothetical protein JXR73_04135 [Candidatus Omnitrophica bacterium]|nr:hypothetical protein [Candidatus Omnitrophota bacterium]